MRNRHLFLFVTVLLAAFLAVGCGARQLTKGEIDQFDGISAKIAKAERMGAKECAPKELAIAKAELDAARHESSESWETAQPFITIADKAADDLLAKTKPCWEAKQVKPAPPWVTLSANPDTIEAGKCATLSWSSTNASSASIDQGIGSVDPSGSRQVCPASTAQYTITTTGEGGSRTASTTVTVNPPPPPPPEPVKEAPPAAPKVIDRMVIHVNFDFAKSDIRKADVAELQKAIDFVKKYPGYKIAIEGHTDHIGSAKYNQALSERRATAVKDYLLKHGMIDTHKDMIMTKGYGKSKPIADNSTEKGRFENRRVEILVLSE
jgi:outer membrane protein OmpA-like peptidoglycan-associated protein